ncbi:MAG: hypothetical protein ACREBW_10475 [Candidatus Micrarchaeaceae archaeon]
MKSAATQQAQHNGRMDMLVDETVSIIRELARKPLSKEHIDAIIGIVDCSYDVALRVFLDMDLPAVTNVWGHTVGEFITMQHKRARDLAIIFSDPRLVYLGRDIDAPEVKDNNSIAEAHAMAFHYKFTLLKSVS